MTIFERFAAAFPLASDEAERWAREGRLLVELARSAGDRRGRILDLACGSGFHARHLALEGFAVAGVDVSAEAIETGRSLPGGDGVTWIEGDVSEPVAGRYDLALLIGNTLSLFEDRRQVERTLAAAADALVPRGALLVHVIDYDYLREHPVRIEREGSLDGTPVTFEKRIDGDATGGLITITVTRQTDSGPRTDSGTQRLHEWGVPMILQAASDAGLVPRGEFGDLAGTPRKPGRTKDIVLIFDLS